MGKMDRLIQQMYRAREKQEPFVLLLGNGASIASGIKPNKTIVAEILAEYEDELPAGSTAQKLQDVWDKHDHLRTEFAERFLTPTRVSPGYRALAQLIQMGLFNPIVTLNFDTILEDELRAIGFNKFTVLFREPDADEGLLSELSRDDGNVKILKLHKPYARDSFLYMANELPSAHYPAEVEEALHQLFRRNVIVCGYSFADLCVTNAFASIPGRKESFHYVSPEGVKGASRDLATVIPGRENEAYEQTFDYFFEDLDNRVVSESIRRDFPLPIARPYSLLVRSQSQEEKVSNLQNLFENVLRFVWAVMLADAVSVQAADPERQRLRTAVDESIRLCSLENVVECCAEFTQCCQSSGSTLFSEPFMDFFRKNLREIREVAKAILSGSLGPHAEPDVYGRYHREVFAMLKNLRWMGSYKLTVELTWSIQAITRKAWHLLLRGEKAMSVERYQIQGDVNARLRLWNAAGSHSVDLYPALICQLDGGRESEIVGECCFYYAKS